MHIHKPGDRKSSSSSSSSNFVNITDPAVGGIGIGDANNKGGGGMK